MELDLKKIEEKYSKKKPTFSLFELLKCIALIFIGCIMFAGMPHWCLTLSRNLNNQVNIVALALKSFLGKNIFLALYSSITGRLVTAEQLADCLKIL